MLSAFLHGLILAFGLIISLGPQKIYIFEQGVSQKRLLHALPSVITAIVCDIILVTSAVLGISLIVFIAPWIEDTLLVVGFGFLIYIGFLTWFRKIKDTHAPPVPAKEQIGFVASLCLLNPHAYVDVMGIIGANSLHFSGINKLAFAVGCILISAIWFFLLATAGHLVRNLDGFRKFIMVLNKISALLIWSFAVYVCRLLYLNVFSG